MCIRDREYAELGESMHQRLWGRQLEIVDLILSAAEGQSELRCFLLMDLVVREKLLLIRHYSTFFLDEIVTDDVFFGWPRPIRPSLYVGSEL